MDFSLTTYYPVFLYLFAVIGLAVSVLAAAHLIGPRRITPVKQMPYESGMDPIGDARQKFDVKFYLIAILFIVFDLEAAFLFPWAVSLDMTGWPGWITMMVFLFELAVGLAYAWKKGALEWE